MKRIIQASLVFRFITMLAAVACLLALMVLTGCGPSTASGGFTDGSKAKDAPPPPATDVQAGVVAEWLSTKDRTGTGTVFGGGVEPNKDAPDGTVMKSVNRPEGNPVVIWKVGDDRAIEGGGGKPPTVKQDKAYFVTEVTTYHWNGGKGAPAGEITLNASDGTVYGPWKATLYNNVYWVARPEQDIPAGTYTLIDSDPSTWAQNSGSGGKGMGWANGIPIK